MTDKAPAPSHPPPPPGCEDFKIINGELYFRIYIGEGNDDQPDSDIWVPVKLPWMQAGAAQHRNCGNAAIAGWWIYREKAYGIYDRWVVRNIKEPGPFTKARYSSWVNKILKEAGYASDYMGQWLAWRDELQGGEGWLTSCHG